MKDETQIYRDINRGRTASTGSKREDPGISDQTRQNTVKTGWNTREPRVDIQYKSALCWRDDLRRFDMLSQSHWSLSVLLFQHAPWTLREYPRLFLHAYFDDCPRNGYQRLLLDRCFDIFLQAASYMLHEILLLLLPRGLWPFWNEVPALSIWLPLVYPYFPCVFALSVLFLPH